MCNSVHCICKSNFGRLHKTIVPSCSPCVGHHFDFVCMHTHSVVPKPKTAINDVGVRLVYMQNRKLTSQGSMHCFQSVFSCSSWQASWDGRYISVSDSFLALKSGIRLHEGLKSGSYREWLALYRIEAGNIITCLEPLLHSQCSFHVLGL